jgi:hypothetical protein
LRAQPLNRSTSPCAACLTNAARANGTACCKAENGQEITELPDGTIIGLPLDEPSEFDPLSKTHALAQGEEQAPATHGPQLAQAPRCGASAHAPPPSELFGPGIYFFKYAEGLYYNVSGGLAPLSLCTTMCPEVSPLLSMCPEVSPLLSMCPEVSPLSARSRARAAGCARC